jgi:Acetyltransferases, including N-acetylases of ribosomal proteins
MKKYSVFLRAFESDDYILINKWRNDPELQHLTVGHRRFVSSEMEKEWVRSKMLDNTKDIYWAICTNDERKKMIGYISVNNIDHWNRTADAGGIVIGDKNEQNAFAAIEATLLQFEYVFEELNMHKLTGSCLAEHKASLLPALSLGYKIEGTLRDNVFKGGKYHDEVVFSILEQDYYEAKDNGLYDFSLIMKRVVALRREMKEKE